MLYSVWLRKSIATHEHWDKSINLKGGTRVWSGGWRDKPSHLVADILLYIQVLRFVLLSSCLTVWHDWCMVRLISFCCLRIWHYAHISHPLLTVAITFKVVTEISTLKLVLKQGPETDLWWFCEICLITFLNRLGTGACACEVNGKWIHWAVYLN